MIVTDPNLQTIFWNFLFILGPVKRQIEQKKMIDNGKSSWWLRFSHKFLFSVMKNCVLFCKNNFSLKFPMTIVYTTHLKLSKILT